MRERLSDFAGPAVMVDFDKVGLLTVRGDRMLLCRKSRDTSLLFLPGGCLEDGESAEQCLRREIAEELGQVELRDPRYIGAYPGCCGRPCRKDRTGPALRWRVRRRASRRNLSPSLVWFGPSDDRDQLSPSLKNKIFAPI